MASTLEAPVADSFSSTDSNREDMTEGAGLLPVLSKALRMAVTIFWPS